MAHHQHQDRDGRPSAVQSLLKALRLSTTPSMVPLAEEELNGETDEPPDDQLSPLSAPLNHKDVMYIKSIARPANERRESLLTRAIRAESNPPAFNPSHLAMQAPPRGLSTASSHSTASMASTAELTSDGNLTTPPHSASPSPPLPPTRFAGLDLATEKIPSLSRVVIAPVTKHELPTVVDVGEAAIEKTLGRKRCIMFACGASPPEKEEKKVEPKIKQESQDPPKRKCMITFACPSRAVKPQSLTAEVLKQDSRPSESRKSSSDSSVSTSHRGDTVQSDKSFSDRDAPKEPASPKTFHEFGGGQEDDEDWVDQPTEYKRKLTLNDCLVKENAIRQLGKEAEEEAEQEEREEEEMDDGLDDVHQEDDFAPSDDDSDGGNESDDEGGFADSDDESDAESEYQFWAPSTAVPGSDNINITHFSARQRSAASSIESLPQIGRGRMHDLRNLYHAKQRASNKPPRMRPGTPELPDSTDFVCGTLDEDRPLEAAYISCREQRKREKHIPIPQDIDPSFPTTDPEDNDDEENEDILDEDELQLSGVEEHTFRGRRGPVPTKISPVHSPRLRSPPPKSHHLRPITSRRTSHRSPPPNHHAAKSPAPRRLFGHSPTRLRSPPPQMRLRSPRGSPTNRGLPMGFAINRLAQRPGMGRTSSLPHTPNPFFRNYRLNDPSTSNMTSAAVTPGGPLDTSDPDVHVRGPVDIVIGLEKKRQKRKEKFWRQHCRKAAKEQAERRPVPGRGAERMKELGLECAERTRGYGLGQPAQLVISL